MFSCSPEFGLGKTVIYSLFEPIWLAVRYPKGLLASIQLSYLAENGSYESQGELGCENEKDEIEKIKTIVIGNLYMFVELFNV